MPSDWHDFWHEVVNAVPAGLNDGSSAKEPRAKDRGGRSRGRQESGAKRESKGGGPRNQEHDGK
jgi:hypothetical protein